MCSPEGRANIGKVVGFLREWDRGDRTVRRRMLKSFLTQSSGKTFYELEMDFAQVASLFLARLTTWLRLTYPYFIFIFSKQKFVFCFILLFVCLFFATLVLCFFIPTIHCSC